MHRNSFIRRALPIAALILSACAMPPTSNTSGARQSITRSDQLPRRSVALPALPSELFSLPPAQLAPTLDAIDAELREELATTSPTAARKTPTAAHA